MQWGLPARLDHTACFPFVAVDQQNTSSSWMHALDLSSLTCNSAQSISSSLFHAAFDNLRWLCWQATPYITITQELSASTVTSLTKNFGELGCRVLLTLLKPCHLYRSNHPLKPQTPFRLTKNIKTFHQNIIPQTNHWNHPRPILSSHSPLPSLPSIACWTHFPADKVCQGP